MIAVLMQARIGHFVEAQILEALEIDYIDESEVLTMAGWAIPITYNSILVDIPIIHP